MGLQKCGGCLSCLLIPLTLWSIVINVLLYFPDGKALYNSSNLTNYVWYFEGICFSGIMMVLLAALLIILDREIFSCCCQSESCTRTYRSVISVVLSLLGIAFSGYSLLISTLGLVQGPYCKPPAAWENIFKGTAGRTFEIRRKRRGGMPFTCFLYVFKHFHLTISYRGPKAQFKWRHTNSYLMDHTDWSECSEPAYVAEWNIILFSILIALSGLQMLVCFLKVIAELKRILCGTYLVFAQPGLI